MACGVWLYREWKDFYVQYEHIVYIWHLTPTYCDASLFVYDLMHTVHKFRLCISDMISMRGCRDSQINIHPNVLPLWAISIELLWELALFKNPDFLLLLLSILKIENPLLLSALCKVQHIYLHFSCNWLD